MRPSTASCAQWAVLWSTLHARLLPAIKPLAALLREPAKKSTQNNLFCAAAGMTANVLAGACNGPCTTSQCCSPPTSCYYSILGCPQGTFNTGQPCQGAQCSGQHVLLCQPRLCPTLGTKSTSHSATDMGFYAGTDLYHCGTKCTQQMCCRRSKTCGEVFFLCLFLFSPLFSSLLFFFSFFGEI